MIGVGFVIEESMTLREKRGRVDDITWSKVDDAPATIAETQAYSLRQLDGLAETLERKASFGDVADAVKDAESKAQEWRSVLARCFQLQDAIAVLELDRVLDASPGELDGHRLGLRAARQDRLDLISRTTERLLARMEAAAHAANAKVLMHPTKAPAVVHSSNHVSGAVIDFHGLLGIEGSKESLEARRWADSASDTSNRAREKGLERISAARRFGSEASDRTRSATGKLSSRADRVRRRGEREGDADDE